MQNITFKPPLKTIKKDEKIINILPFSIHYEGNADVDIYFNSKSKPLNGKF